MFTNNLNNNQQGKLRTLTQMLIHANNTTEHPPTRRLKSIKKSSVSHITSTETAILELEDTFITQSSKVSLMLELMSAAYSHQSHGDERGLIQAIAWKLNIPPQLLKDMECWAELQSILTKEAKIFMGETSCH